MASQTTNGMSESPSVRLQKDLEESLLSRLLNAVEIFMKEEDRLPKDEEADNNTKFRDLINFFLSQKKDFDILSPNYSTLLHFIVRHGDNASFMSLLNSKTNLDVNSFNSKGTTLMHIIAINGTCEMMQALLDRGANINIRTANFFSENISEQNNNEENKGYTPLHCAAFAGNLEILEMLLKKGADIDALSYYGTPLHFACGAINGNMENDYLLKKKSLSSDDKIIRDEDRAKIVQLLLDRGASSEIRDSNGKTALQRACFNGNYKVMIVLLDHVAPV